MQHASHQVHDSTLPEWIPLLLIVIVVVLYLLSHYSLVKSESSWKSWRTFSFIVGVVLLGIATMPSMMQWAHQDLVGHMVQHLLIGMYGPLFLVLGAPILLALKALPVNMARYITTILRSGFFYFISHPVTTLVLNMGGMFLLYLTPLFAESLSNSLLHYFIHLHFLAAGFLFTWSMIGPEPVAKRPGFRIRVYVLFINIAAHAFLSKFMYAYLYPLNTPYSDSNIREAAKLMYYWGDLSELLLAIALFTVWYRKRNATIFSAPSLS